MSAFVDELLQTRIYKRSQGRITRQITFAALALSLAVGVWRLHQAMIGIDPTVPAQPAEATYVAPTGKAAEDAVIRISGVGQTGKPESAEVKITKGEDLDRIIDSVNAHADDTGVAAGVEDHTLKLATIAKGGKAEFGVEVVAGHFPLAGLDAGNMARGRSTVDLGLRFAIPGLLLVLGFWLAYRAVNMAGFADFLIAVEAEMNKVSWPTRHELIRASVVVLILIIVLAVVLLAFDLIWQQLFHWLGII